ncbi:MAG: AIM24 family protein [Dysgonamonadaceae bacterium]|jgi:uncharacterized protein (AIM24 family)|nr:AIM24 family protein [Dysgonamonadaceae bacterium]
MNVKIVENIFQYIEIELAPTEEFITECGAMSYYDYGLSRNVLVGGIFKRIITREEVTVIKYKNETSSNKKLLLSSNAFVVPIKIDAVQNEIICAKSAFFCSTKDIQMGMRIDNNVKTGLFGGMGFFRQKIIGQGTIFLKSLGPVKKIELTGNKIIVDSSAILAFSNTINYSNKMSNFFANVFSGEGGSQEELSGSGTVWLQCYNEPLKSSPTGCFRCLVCILVVLAYLFFLILSNIIK